MIVQLLCNGPGMMHCASSQFLPRSCHECMTNNSGLGVLSKPRAANIGLGRWHYQGNNLHLVMA